MIDFLDIKSINKQYSKEIESRILEVFNSGWYVLGKEVLDFEKELSNFCSVKNVIGVANGLDALRLILKHI